MSNQRWNTLCMSTLKFTKLNNVKSTLSISSLILTTLDNVETMLLFATSTFITLINVETTLWIWPFSNSWKEQKNIFELQKKKMTDFINNTCFGLWSIKKKYGTYNAKINVGKYTAWYMKRIWKYQYEFADGKIKWCKE